MTNFQRGIGEYRDTDGPTISARFERFPPDCPVPVKLQVPLRVAKARAQRSFWRGVVIGGLLTGASFIAGAAFSADLATWGGTGCKLVPVADQDHVAEVRCVNTQTTGDAVTSGEMEADGLWVSLTVLHGAGDIPDEFAIVPMPGFVAVPPLLVLDEHTRGTAVIIPWEGM